jgi:hypothetical protein
VAGVEFFKKAEAAAAVEARSRDALETFFLCVALGFQGRYARFKDRRPRWSAPGEVEPQLVAWGKGAFRLVRGPLEPFMAPGKDDRKNDPDSLPGRALLLRVSILTACTVLFAMAAMMLSDYLNAG